MEVSISIFILDILNVDWDRGEGRVEGGCHRWIDGKYMENGYPDTGVTKTDGLRWDRGNFWMVMETMGVLEFERRNYMYLGMYDAQTDIRLWCDQRMVSEWHFSSSEGI